MQQQGVALLCLQSGLKSFSIILTLLSVFHYFPKNSTNSSNRSLIRAAQWE
ncbi:hypothetical protein HMPREF9061_01416 [Actinomyces sp. oral taxon 181 str. F0379]|nr:hypothetical protein HMPREF9061_01416 [Actinomyces sp. oral taxon 181 str. F0379]